MQCCTPFEEGFQRLGLDRTLTHGHPDPMFAKTWFVRGTPLKSPSHDWRRCSSGPNIHQARWM